MSCRSARSRLDDAPVTTGMVIPLPGVDLQPIAWRAAHHPRCAGEISWVAVTTQTRNGNRRDSVWRAPEQRFSLDEYFLNLLRYSQPDAKLSIA